MSLDAMLTVERTLNRVKTRVGHTNKVRRYTTNQALVLEYILKKGGTIDFRGESKEMKEIGLKTIWELMSYEMALDDNFVPVANPNQMQRCDSARRHAKATKHAVIGIRKQLRIDSHFPLLLTPRFKGGTHVAVITIYRDYMVNEVEDAETLALATGDERTKAKLRSCMTAHELMTGTRDGVAKRFLEIVEEIRNERLTQPMLNFDGPSTALD